MAMYKKPNSAILEEQKKFKDFGLKLITEFHKFNQRYPVYKLSLDQLIYMLEKRPNQKNFLSILGGSVLASQSSQGEALLAMQTLAFKSMGRIPSQNVDFKSAIINKATSFKFVDAVVYTVVETASQVVEGVQAVGDTLIDTGKILRLLFPIAVVYFLYLFLKKKVS